MNVEERTDDGMQRNKGNQINKTQRKNGRCPKDSWSSGSRWAGGRTLSIWRHPKNDNILLLAHPLTYLFTSVLLYLTFGLPTYLLSDIQIIQTFRRAQTSFMKVPTPDSLVQKLFETLISFTADLLLIIEKPNATIGVSTSMKASRFADR